MNASSQAWVGLGSNLDDPAAQVAQGFAALDALPQTRCLQRSGLYRTAPIGPQDQPDFCNAVAMLETRLAPVVLLAELQAVEQAAGRRRGRRWGPRRLDLDLLLYDDNVLQTNNLTLPHPRMHARAFVLAPLAELAPALRIPGHGNVAQLARAVADQQVTPWT